MLIECYQNKWGQVGKESHTERMKQAKSWGEGILQRDKAKK